jgi:hypothetical protein
MPKTYLTVSLSGDVGVLMHEYLGKNKNRFPTIVNFLDEAVLEKLYKEINKPLEPKIVEQPNQVIKNDAL